MNKELFRVELALPSRQFLAAGRAGVLPVPANIAAAYDAFDRAGTARYSHTEIDLQAARDGYAAQVADALRSDTALPAATAVEQVTARAREHEEVRRGLVAAELILIVELRASLPSADGLVTDHIRLALADAHDQARPLLTRHGPILSQPADAAITAGPAASKAWTEFGTLATRTSALRVLHRQVTDPDISEDTRGEYANWTDTADHPDLWGDVAAGRHMRRWKPWPDQPRPYLAWLLSSGLTLWTPTAAERDARWTEATKATKNRQLAGIEVN